MNFLHLDYTTTLVCGGVETELMWQAYTLAYINITKKNCHSVLFSYTSVPSVHTIITSSNSLPRFLKRYIDILKI